MSEPKDPAIKLFGKTIALPEASPATPPPSSSLATLVSAADGNYAAVSHDHDSPSSRLSPEGNTDGDGEDLEAEKVWICLQWFFTFSFALMAKISLVRYSSD